MITVSPDGRGDFTSVNEAVRHASPDDVIYIKNGVYRERVEILTEWLTLIGEDKHRTVIEYGLYAKIPCEDGGKLGTFRSYTMLVNTDNFICKNITVANTAGFGADVGQAVAVYAEGDNLTFENCRFLGHQDTLFTGPLPFKEVEKGGFKGPTEFAQRKTGRHFYRRCYIEGEVDFIFGCAAAYFEECELFSLDCGKEINGYVTAASTYKGEKYGYIFNRCRFTGNCPEGTVYLGRPWRDHAQTVLIDCEIGSHINSELFHDRNKTNARDTVFYGVCGCNASKEKAAPFVKFMDRTEADRILSYVNQRE
ncbi:MAG: pectin methylesterase [Oscillospiraceae bacterium]|nr:pectin methylesterase [Oscillospiraceae bacterium]